MHFNVGAFQDDIAMFVELDLAVERFGAAWLIASPTQPENRLNWPPRNTVAPSGLPRNARRNSARSVPIICGGLLGADWRFTGDVLWRSWTVPGPHRQLRRRQLLLPPDGAVAR